MRARRERAFVRVAKPATLIPTSPSNCMPGAPLSRIITTVTVLLLGLIAVVPVYQLLPLTTVLNPNRVTIPSVPHPLPTIAHRTPSAVTLPERSPPSTRDHPADRTLRQFSPEQLSPGECAAWTYRHLVYPRPPYLNVSISKSASTGLLTAQWTGTFSGPVHACDPSAPPLLPSEIEGLVSPRALLCGYGTSRPVRTVVLAFRDEPLAHWNDLVDPDLNVLHFHAQFFAVWLSLRLADVSATLLHTDTLHPPLDVILLFPPAAVSRFGNPSVPFRPSPEQLAQRRVDGAHHAALAGLQAVAQAITLGSVLVASTDHSGAQISQALAEAGMEGHAALWVTPPSREPFLWSLEYAPLHMAPHPTTTDTGDDSCVNSRTQVLADYRNAFISTDGSNEHISSTTALAKHVCFISRQNRPTRNLSSNFFITLIKRLGSPLLLSPTVHLRNSTAVADVARPLLLDDASLAEQMRYVHNECAVLVGVQGAGLAHTTLSLRPGAHVVELHSDLRANYSLFENIAALLPNVTHARYRLESQVVNSTTAHEIDLHLDDTPQVDALVAFIFERVELSLRTQATLRTAAE